MPVGCLPPPGALEEPGRRRVPPLSARTAGAGATPTAPRGVSRGAGLCGHLARRMAPRATPLGPTRTGGLALARSRAPSAPPPHTHSHTRGPGPWLRGRRGPGPPPPRACWRRAARGLPAPRWELLHRAGAAAAPPPLLRRERLPLRWAPGGSRGPLGASQGPGRLRAGAPWGLPPPRPDHDRAGLRARGVLENACLCRCAPAGLVLLLLAWLPGCVSAGVPRAVLLAVPACSLLLACCLSAAVLPLRLPVARRLPAALRQALPMVPALGWLFTGALATPPAPRG